MRASPRPALNRLTHVTETSRGYPTVERAYTYDSLGNMIQEEAEECLEFHYHGYTLYENRECCTRAEYNGVKRWDYTYDGRGNLTSIDKYQRTTQGMQLVNSEKYVYDETGKLVQGTNEDGEVSLYTYNGLGVRVGRELIVQDNTHGYTDFHKETPSVETGLSKPEVVKESYVVDYTRYTLDTLVKEESGGNTDRWLYGYQSLQVKITSEGTDWWGQQTSQNVLTAYTHHDRLGSIVNLTDQYGRNLVRADYREYGEIEFYETVTVNGGYRQIAPQLVYTNHEYDTVLELYYAKARFYDPADKRFLSMDPVKGSIADPLSLTPYLYCVDNPLRYVDPLGKMYRLIVRDSSGKILKAADTLDDRYASQRYFSIKEITQKHVLSTIYGDIKLEYDERSKKIKVEVLTPNSSAKTTTKYSMEVSISQMMLSRETAATFLPTDELTEYKESTHQRQPTVYFKYFNCLFGDDDNSVYVNIDQLANLLGLNVQPLKLNDYSATAFYDRLMDTTEKTYDYVKASVKQVLLGNYADEITWLGTAGEIAVGFSGADILQDFRDVIYDIQYWDWTLESAGRLAIDGVGLLPIIGILKNADEASLLIKHGDDIAVLGKHADDVADTIGTLMPDLKKFEHAAQYGIDTYGHLKQAKKFSGLEAHHIIPKEFAKLLNVSQNGMLSVVLTHAEHLVFTQQWNEALRFSGYTNGNVPIDLLWQWAQKIYAEYPTLIEAARKTLFP